MPPATQHQRINFVCFHHALFCNAFFPFQAATQKPPSKNCGGWLKRSRASFSPLSPSGQSTERSACSCCEAADQSPSLPRPDVLLAAYPEARAMLTQTRAFRRPYPTPKRVGVFLSSDTRGNASVGSRAGRRPCANGRQPNSSGRQGCPPIGCQVSVRSDSQFRPAAVPSNDSCDSSPHFPRVTVTQDEDTLKSQTNFVIDLTMRSWGRNAALGALDNHSPASKQVTARNSSCSMSVRPTLTICLFCAVRWDRQIVWRS
jgi:hypothetical protein